ncbi:transposase family protein [Streptomyces sp. NK15101]|uniref:transposase family protein n=1 Tax=Streptomyces sp. NK15101 TaxID=2873261 RepID=UPI001CEC4C4F|nr:transposase family protein [Streptomyces sp. NK15101]
MLVHPSGVDVSSSTLRFLTQQLRRHRRAIGSRWRRLSAGRQALLTLAPSLADAVRTASVKAYLILDGTLLPIDRIAADRTFSSGKHKKHGVNVQVIADPFGRLPWASPALPGAVHDLRAAREHGILDALAEAGMRYWADKDYRGAGGTVRVPCWGRWENLSAGQKAANRSHAKIRALVEPAVATLKYWRLLRKLRCSTTRITRLVRAVLTLHLTSSN